MLHLIWSDEARADFIEILDYIDQRNPAASQRLRTDVLRIAESLPSYPYLYRSGRVPGTREAVVWPNYLLIYRVNEASIDILRVLHAAREYPHS